MRFTSIASCYSAFTFDWKASLDNFDEFTPHKFQNLRLTIILKNLFIGLTEKSIFIILITISYSRFRTKEFKNCPTYSFLVFERQVLFQEVFDLNVMYVVFMIIFVLLYEFFPDLFLVFDINIFVNLEGF